MMHTLDLRVYYEDTDLAGIVYYANYLKFIERGRTEAVRTLGIDQGRLKADLGIVFAVRRVEADYLRPAVFDDVLSVRTTISALGGASIDMVQQVWRDDVLLFDAKVRLVCLRADGRACRMTAEIRHLLGQGLTK